MDGHEATAQLRRTAFPIVGVTANVLESDRDRFVEKGLSDFLHKPVADGLGRVLQKHGLCGRDPFRAADRPKRHAEETKKSRTTPSLSFRRPSRTRRAARGARGRRVSFLVSRGLGPRRRRSRPRRSDYSRGMTHISRGVVTRLGPSTRHCVSRKTLPAGPLRRRPRDARTTGRIAETVTARGVRRPRASLSPPSPPPPSRVTSPRSST